MMIPASSFLSERRTIVNDSCLRKVDDEGFTQRRVESQSCSSRIAQPKKKTVCFQQNNDTSTADYLRRFGDCEYSSTPCKSLMQLSARKESFDDEDEDQTQKVVEIETERMQEDNHGDGIISSSSRRRGHNHYHRQSRPHSPPKTKSDHPAGQNETKYNQLQRQPFVRRHIVRSVSLGERPCTKKTSETKWAAVLDSSILRPYRQLSIEDIDDIFIDEEETEDHNDSDSDSDDDCNDPVMIASTASVPPPSPLLPPPRSPLQEEEEEEIPYVGKEVLLLKKNKGVSLPRPPNPPSLRTVKRQDQVLFKMKHRCSADTLISKTKITSEQKRPCMTRSKSFPTSLMMTSPIRSFSIPNLSFNGDDGDDTDDDDGDGDGDGELRPRPRLRL